MVKFILDVSARAQDEKGECSGDVQTLVVGSEFQGRYPAECIEFISLEAVEGAEKVLELSVAALRPLIGRTERSTLTALALMTPINSIKAASRRARWISCARQSRHRSR